MSRALLVVVVCFAVVSGGFAAPADATPRPGVHPVPSLTPVATQKLWSELTQRPRRLHSLTAATCAPLRAVFYAPTDWLRLATKLAATPSPCAQYYVSVPPLAADKTQLRADQAWRIRALGPAFHAMAEINVTGWTSWVAATGNSWREAGIEARRRMAAAGYDVSAGDTWALNELSSAVRQGTGSARANMRAFLSGLHDGDDVLPAARGTVFVVGIGQPTSDLSLYQARLQDWYEDAAFWNDLSRYAADWSQELYGDVRSYAAAGASRDARRDALTEYLQHQTALAAVAPASASEARTFLSSFHSPLANAAWQYDAAFGWTNVSAALMEDYVSAQVYAMRAAGSARFGFPWSPRNLAGMPSADFNAQTDALLVRLAAAIADSAAEPEAACATTWCAGVLDGAALTPAWRTFASWKPSTLAFTTSPQSVAAGVASEPVTVELRTFPGASYTAGLPVPVTVSASSSSVELAAAPGGPWSATTTVDIVSGASSASVYARGSSAGSFTITAAAAGKTASAQAFTVTTPPDTTPPETTIDSAPSGSSGSVAFSANEPGARFECSLDGAAFAACTSPAAYAGLVEGAHSFDVRAIDGAGNVDASPARASWTVAAPPPSGGGGGGNGAGPDLVVAASAMPTAPTVGTTVTYVLALRNLGSPATRASLTVQLPSQVTYVSSQSDRGPGCTGTTMLLCDLDFLSGDLVATLRIQTVVREAGTLTLTATSSAQPGDVQTANDVTTVVVTVASPVAQPPPPVARPPALAVVGRPAVARRRTGIEVSVRFSVAAAARLRARVTPLASTRTLTLLPGTTLAGRRTAIATASVRRGTYLFRARLRPSQLIRGRTYLVRVTSVAPSGSRTLTVRVRA